MQQFFDHFALANKSIQERLGAAQNALNKLSALYGMQARGFVQMLSYGDDMITARAASHLLNMDILRANDAYLLKLGEGFLLNSIESITPPLIHSGNEFLFSSVRTYEIYDSVGSVALRDGSSANLLIYKFNALEEKTADGEQKYQVLYCAGQYITQTFSTDDIDLTPGTFQSIYVPETYKAIWTPSVRVKLAGIEKEVVPIFSMAELLAYTDRDNLVLCQHTGRGLTITLGDGEVFGAGYNNKQSFANITFVEVSYIKTDSLSEAANETLQFNSDVTPLYSDRIPVLDKPSTGDTPEMFRSRAIAEMFASGKITDEKDLVTEIRKIPIIRSCAAHREQNRHFPVKAFDWDTYNKWKKGKLPYPIIYPHGSMVEDNDALYVVVKKDKGSETLPPSDPTSAWQVIVPADIYAGLKAMGFDAESAFRYDNATIVLSGLMVANRRYWSPDHSYGPGDIVYHAKTNALYVCIKGVDAAPAEGEIIPGVNNLVGEVRGIEPGTDEGAEYWMSQADVEINPLYSGYRIDDYVPITQAAYELELKGYFGIASKLGFTSVVVEPCVSVPVTISYTYDGAHRENEEITRFIQNYACYNVGKRLLASELHSMLTEQFGLTKVYIWMRRGDAADGADASEVPLATSEYISKSDLTVTPRTKE